MNKIDMLKNVVRNVGDNKFISCYVEIVHSVTCPLRYLLHSNVLDILVTEWTCNGNGVDISLKNMFYYSNSFTDIFYSCVLR